MDALLVAAAIAATSILPSDQTGTVLRIVLTDAARGSMANTSLGAEPRHLWVDTARCSIGTSSSAATTADGIAWSVTGRIVTQQGDLYTVEIGWVRTEKGVAGTPTAPRTITLRTNERVLLDRTTTSGACGTGELRLEATIGTPGDGGGVAAAVRPAAGRGVGAGMGRGGGGGAGAASSSATSVGMGGGGGGGAGAGGRGRPTTSATGVPPGATIELRAPTPPIDAELWLVHRAPNGLEQVTPLTARVGGAFTFPAVAVTTSAGPINIVVSGSIHERVVNGVADGLAFDVKRTARSATAGSSGDGSIAVEYQGETSQHLAMPAANEVFSFTIPGPLNGRGRPQTGRGGGGGGTVTAASAMLSAAQVARELEAHRFEVRLRIKSK